VPILNRAPELSYTLGLLMVLATIMLVAAIRYFPFFLHQVFGVR